MALKKCPPKITDCQPVSICLNRLLYWDHGVTPHVLNRRGMSKSKSLWVTLSCPGEENLTSKNCIKNNVCLYEYGSNMVNKVTQSFQCNFCHHTSKARMRSTYEALNS